ncbi:MAG: phosphoribosylamine--glycine ligase [Tissierellales bacterium]
MRVLVIGSGAREHAIVWKLAQSSKVAKIFSAPGNGGIQELAKCVDIKDTKIDELLSFALKENIDLTIVGPETSLVAGIVDRFNEKGLKIFGPCKNGAKLEGSKKYSKEFMMKYDIPTARYAAYDKLDDALEGLKEFVFPLVIKADGLACGKGVVICNNRDQACEAIKSIMADRKFGEAGNEIIIEEFLQGIEASLMCLVDGNKIIPLESARDYKRLLDNDEGPNTGGMGCISPNKVLDGNLMSRIEKEILNKVITGIQKENMNYRGIIFIGLMITSDGPKVLEFNVRFGDPETEVVLPRLESDIVDIILKTIDGDILKEDLKWSPKSCICTVLASPGYPEESKKGENISGINEVDENIIVFHAGTKREKELTTNGGRVLAVTTLSDSIYEGRKNIYKNISKIHFKGIQYRKDIGYETDEVKNY